MININDVLEYEQIGIDEEWNDSENRENKMHSVHAYPAKFPAFIAAKAFDYARQEGVEINKVADVFCGCGTVALEAKLHNLDFWGCDINPVATLIAKAKSTKYKIKTFEKYYSLLFNAINDFHPDAHMYEIANERLKYWFSLNSYLSLLRIKQGINNMIPIGKYQSAYMCIFSSILKASSRWLTKSIKPQIDPNKREIDVLAVFTQQYHRFLKAIEETQCEENSKIIIKRNNFLTIKKLPNVDLVITSPPYVTSYEYADLHQLSSLWLDYTDDYRDLRKGSIGSIYNSEDFAFDTRELNVVGQEIVDQLLKNRKMTAKVKAVARYYVDIQHVIEKCSNIINKRGMVFFIVGDTEYKGVKIENSKHLVECLIENGFEDIKVTKRKISKKLLTPYRDSIGRFSTDKTQRAVYHEEFIISGRKF